MNTFNQEAEEMIPEYLSSLEETVLEELSVREKHYTFRFNGLRRVLNDVHQQKLTRALERLQEDHLIERHPDGGYGLDKKYYDKIRERFGSKPLSDGVFSFDLNKQKNYSAVTTSKEFPVQTIIDKLTGKYFGSFRFIGHYYANGKGRLEWIHAENQSKILITQISPYKIEISANNVSNLAINRFLRLIRQVLLEHKIFVNLTEEHSAQAN
jgi:hypothetical protein